MARHYRAPWPWLRYLRAAPLALTLGALAAVTPGLAAQQTTAVTVRVWDLAGEPLPGVALTVVDAAGLEQGGATDAHGRLALAVAGASVWLRAAVGPDGSALVMDANTADGGLLLPLDGTPVVLDLLLDDTLLFRAPAVLDNPAFPEDQPPGAAALGAAPTALLGGASAAAAEPGAPARRPLALLLIAAVGGLALLLLLLIWLWRVWRYRQRRGRGRR